MRTAVCLAAGIAAFAAAGQGASRTARADDAADPALVTVETRLGYGATLGGGGGGTVWRASPITLSVLADVAIRDQPWTTTYAGLTAEGGDRASVGAIAGLRLQPGHAGMRVGAGVVGIVAPYTLFGGAASVGRCWHLAGSTSMCADVEATFFAAGSDLPDGRVSTQLQLLIGVRFDAD